MNNTTTSKKDEVFATVSFWVGVSSAIISLVLTIILFVGFRLYQENNRYLPFIALWLCFIVLIYSSVNISNAITGIIFRKLSSKAIVNKPRSRLGLTFSILSLCLSTLTMMLSILFYIDIFMSFRFFY